MKKNKRQELYKRLLNQNSDDSSYVSDTDSSDDDKAYDENNNALSFSEKIDVRAMPADPQSSRIESSLERKIDDVDIDLNEVETSPQVYTAEKLPHDEVDEEDDLQVHEQNRRQLGEC